MLLLSIACGSGSTGSPSAETPENRGVLPPTATSVPLFADSGFADPLDTVPEIELVGIDAWINTPGLELDQLTESGQVILIDFWTYTCVNCVRTFPFLRSMHEKYESHGLTVIGVHSPEFEFEKEFSNVSEAVSEAMLEYPIALDSEKLTWDAFGNHFWPTTYLIGAKGDVKYRHFGEGGYDATEAQIRDALEEAGADLSQVEPGGDFSPTLVENAHTQTREIYTGYERGYESAGLFAAQDRFYLAPDVDAIYVDEKLRRHGQFELHGRWRNESDGVVFTGTEENPSGYLVFPFLASSVNMVIAPGGASSTLIVELNGEPLPESVAGDDITYDDAGRSTVVIDQPRLYRIVEGTEFELSELKLLVTGPGVKFHSFTFGVFTEGP